MPRTLLRQARTHQATLPRADILAARIAEPRQDEPAEALLLYLHALEMSPGLALEIIPAVLAVARRTGNTDCCMSSAQRLQTSGRVSPRQLAWLLATAVPPRKWRRLPGVTREFGAERGVGRRGQLAQRAADPHRRCRRALPVR